MQGVHFHQLDSLSLSLSLAHSLIFSLPPLIPSTSILLPTFELEKPGPATFSYKAKAFCPWFRETANKFVIAQAAVKCLSCLPVTTQCCVQRASLLILVSWFFNSKKSLWVRYVIWLIRTTLYAQKGHVCISSMVRLLRDYFGLGQQKLDNPFL